MTTPLTSTARSLPDPYAAGGGGNLADILERVLNTGIVIAGDIRINLLDIELLTIKLRLVVASVDKAKEMGIDWWEDDPALSSRARGRDLAEENAELRARIEELTAGGQDADGSPAAEDTEDTEDTEGTDAGAVARGRER
ncbi:putative gas vesicle protein GvpJ 1 [Streptomyces sulfonofaciens]|uniref:Gas vesicle protein GvpJ 1 n=1 Tax=Streptomyces sulfonofaciens TaxID=68272 RepID=A0A919L5D9_9ACTN|nr:gas vesicle protein [Streptomyces sulfonofaciens]GHH84069.1 putative gas vesicle protein GvpJ 1 [Streptomyces sulfonofaciens]